ncbi:uncharacterized protein LOC135219160 [Macrobrachium nipponense]|uniref:uncharacterized protein LOC135219160 n=1 Tax=Macrobrachium nipponense TaxID=159736 RepID=UPI0030C894B4
MGTSLNSSGLRLEDHNNLKYAISLTRVGQELFLRVFKWGYKGRSASIKNAILELPSYTKTRFRKDFNNSQREKIENGDLLSMDITLLYKLLQMVCGLSEQSDSVWIMPESDSLEYCLYSIKMKRNEMAHDGMMLSSTELDSMIEELRVLFLNTVDKASVTYNVDSVEKNDLIHLINTRLDAIKNSPLPLPTLAEHKKEVFLNCRTCIIDEGRREMVSVSEIICETSVVPCLTQQTVNVSNLYTEPKLRRDEMQITQRQLSAEESYVGIHELLEAKECDGFIPDIIVISALNGMGRSTLLKYVFGNGLNNVMKGTECIDLYLYLECRKVSFSTVEELTSLLLPRTSSTFQSEQFSECFFSIDVLVMFDDVDELDSDSFPVFEKFVRLITPRSRVVVTASREKAKDVQRKLSSLHKRTMLLELEGITESQTLKHLQKVLRTIPAKNHNRHEQELYELIKSKYPQLQEHLRSPEVLGLVAFGWCYAPDRINETTTVTEIFLLVEDLLVHKIYLDFLSSTLPSMHDHGTLNSNLYELLLTISNVAFDTLKKGHFCVESENLQRIVSKCSELDLPGRVISLFLSYVEENTNSLAPVRKVSFPRRSTLQYYAAWFITQQIKEADPSTSIKDIMRTTDFSNVSLPNYQAMFKYLVGMFATLIPSELESRAKEIVEILKELQVSKGSLWLQYIEEAKLEPTITLAILEEMGDVWEIEDYSVSLTLKSILKLKRPSILVLTICKNPSDFPHLEQVLVSCREYQEINISLHVYQHFWSEKTEFSDHYLRLLLGGNSPCILEHFAGRLSGEAMQLLPNSLKRLALHITPDMIRSLNICLKKLPMLRMLYINLDISETVDPSSVAPLNTVGEAVVLSVDIWRVHDGIVEWSCDVAKALTNSYARLVLRHSSLDVNSCFKWLRVLRERAITASWIVVGSIYDVTQEDERQLQQYAVNVGCRKFVWLKI